MYVCMYVCVYVCIYVCMYVCMCLCCYVKRVLQDQYADLILDCDPETVQELLPDMVVGIKSLWADNGVGECYDRRREFQLADSCK